jgi:hypothetical protein
VPEWPASTNKCRSFLRPQSRAYGSKDNLAQTALEFHQELFANGELADFTAISDLAVVFCFEKGHALSA